MIDWIDQFFTYIESKKKLPAQTLDQLRLHIVIEKIPRNTCILHYGAMSDKMYFICQGAMRGEMREMENEEWQYKSSRFMMEQEIVFNVESFDDQVPSREAIYTLEPVIALTINRNEYYDLEAAFPELGGLRADLAFGVIKKDNKRIEGKQSLNVEKRIIYLIENEPEWMKRVPQIYLASYTSTTPENFSRTLKKIRRKGLNRDGQTNEPS
ncbi:Crp/Fnr family transcriptional regulator [Paraflavitalea pollutisoli]|uniref:Crp/Fnr family transcriptional regulator n=1 Tax=Paraflavitalea pollutisoli TaxID=3034143 RepID=UPI0023EC889C|nr:Crp/Fnr family transcriptional regulator [Paraflavitalea sp. H1-2-19X]